MLTQYTSYDEIRAAIGVAQEEIEDDVLSLPNYELILGFDLDELGDFTPTVQALFLALIDNTVTPSPTVNEARFVSIMQVYAPYVIARHLLRTLTMFAPKLIKDSKTEMDRMTDPYADTKVAVESFYQLMRTRLLAAYGVLYPSTTFAVIKTPVPLIAVGLAADPVTGV